MTAVKAIILGLIQGIAEFLPVSSSGHLALFKNLLGLEQVPLVFDVILHMATLCAVVLVFWKRIAGILKALWLFVSTGKTNVSTGGAGLDEGAQENLAVIPPLLAATAITAVLGYAIQKFFNDENVKLVAARMLITAAILSLTFFAKPGTKKLGAIGIGRSALIGIAQGIGVFSGISRSGITISAGIFSGLDREAAGEFSFLLSIPAILGALVLTLKDAGSLMAEVSAAHLALAFVTAFLSGYLALRFLMKIVKNGKLYWFAPYLLLVGAAGLLFL